MKNTLGYVCSLGTDMISWCLRKQEIVAQFSKEAKYLAAGSVAPNQFC